ncbi:TOMM precursor leader peptide-binding protein [Rhodococcus sp. CH91]|uniref:TOMM precursor leader peptide-binding protein n=1 Tax=Rhodococcus sp. CH91 TaxID=2910256 RepID=UPI001F4B0ACF|nr:TOMM precursor leader peptide-binding protein [Rhodococcus sp. CH91]
MTTASSVSAHTPPATSGLLVDPELPVLERSDGAVQLGWGPDTATVVVPPEGMDGFDVGVLLRLLDGRLTGEEVLAAAALRGLSPAPVRELLDELVASGVVRQAPGPSGERLRPRRVRVYGSGPLAAAIVDDLPPWEVRWVRSPVGDGHPDPAAATGCVVLADRQVPDPRLVRALVRAGIPHLPVRIRDGRGVVGPFVLPGRSSCLRCADLVRTDLDPSWPRLATQLYGREGQAGRAVTSATAALAVVQIEAFFSADPSVSPAVDRTLELDLRTHRIAARRWFRHPECDCSAIASVGQA